MWKLLAYVCPFLNNNPDSQINKYVFFLCSTFFWVLHLLPAYQVLIVLV